MRDDDLGLEMEEGEVFVDSLDDEADAFLPEGDEDLGLELEEALTKEVDQMQQSLAGVAGEDELLAKIVRREIDSLRELLQAEIADLRNAIKGGPE